MPPQALSLEANSTLCKRGRPSSDVASLFMLIDLNPTTTLPEDGTKGALAGRVWLPDVKGPAIAAIRDDGVHDITAAFATMRDLCESDDPAKALRAARGKRIDDLTSILANTDASKRDASKPWLLAPTDLHALKAAGVTFGISMLE